ncbi:MAG: Copper-exporting P-type ATPase B [Methanomassiliicoccales archaeon PtaU1.Bin124]|nr:MAG: Copper-exporting P-type ATPase B [Methanomassiliicoccales archaeon PtaU1.Bin124]
MGQEDRKGRGNVREGWFRKKKENVCLEGECELWHAYGAQETLDKLGSTREGLKADEVQRRQKEHGPNLLPSKKPPTILALFFRQFLSPLIYVLVAAGVVSAAMGDLKDGIFIFIVLLINAIIGTVQEAKAEKSAGDLQKLMRTTARVRRGGKEEIVPAEELVPGDIVFLESGTRVPADMRLLEVQGLKVDESLLTGESVGVDKDHMAVGIDTDMADRENMAYAGSTVSSGRAIGTVVEIGGRTEIGRIAKAVTMVEDAKPPLLIRLERFSKQISYIILLAAAGMAVLALLRGMPLMDVFFLAVALAVSAIPEGLPVAVTVAMAIRVTKMAKRNVLTRRLAAVESLGSCTCIASDKTGTLTVNRQTVRLVCLGPGKTLSVSGDGYSGAGEVTMEDGSPLTSDLKDRLVSLARTSVICNEASLDSADGGWSYTGDSVDVALLALGYKTGLDVPTVRRSLSSRGDVPFESERRYAAKFYHEDGVTKVAVKGAVETVMELCSTMNCHDGVGPLDAQMIERESALMTGNGYRVLAVAEGEVDGSGPLNESSLKGLTFLGIIGMIDPPRLEVKEAIQKCTSAGIKVVMVTGDHPSTALAIAKDLGIASTQADVTNGKELEALGDTGGEAFLRKVESTKVFARVTPLQKLHIVEALIKLDNFVAVTGDGVNDAPALRKANIGVAMGSGTDVAKDASSIIVTDDNFASIVAGVEEGRYAYENVRKVTYLLVSTGMAEIMLFILALIFGAFDDATGKLIIPLLAVQLLWLNVVTNGIQHVTLAMEGGDPAVMNRPPRDPKEGIFDKIMIRQVLLSSAFMGMLAFLVYYYLGEIAGYSAFQASNLTLLFLVFMENVHVLNCRSERDSLFHIPISRNYPLLAGIVGAQAIHIIAMNTPLLQDVLKIGPVTLEQWGMLLCLALTLLVVMETYKLLLRRSERKGLARDGPPGH